MKGSTVSVLMIVGALAAGGAAAYVANSYISQTIDARQTALEARYTPVNVAVANADLHAGDMLSAKTVAVRGVPREFLHAEAVPADRWNDVAGRVLARDVRS